jgi:hypothetical protein
MLRFWSKVDKRKNDECWPWLASARKKNEGYGAFWLDGRHQPASRVALLVSGVDVPAGMVVCHRCDNPTCCNPAHLFVGTPLENNKDKIEKRRDTRGERSPHAKLTAEQVAFIRSFKPPGVKRVQAGLPSKLAVQFGISRQYVSELFKRGWA